MARPRSLNFDGQRHTIVSRAAELFARRGYQGTSMNEVAQACALSKATLYHYYEDKYDLLLSIADDHVSMLVEMTDNADLAQLPGAERLRLLITGFMQAYATAQSQHRVLTEDVKFLEPADRKRVLDKERRVVAVFANAIADVRPDLRRANLTKPLAMLLFGTLNWMFTWFKRDGELTHATLAPVVIDLFFGGLAAIKVPARAKERRLEGSSH